ncbi:retrovirus-related Pol polyprotein from transposon TNT 1-94 [Corchorus capsularis]|uniref:Retrovirus-related Pol polyprotein from transposon TNT 1-94 n=1 Tax=Corchorus capsularis TaxID=210143 RepID=A0A1R3ISK3_COCAP|nr:retrovirus-related Pol polyprotein from transposon TNT 1-94 [Corchorus capsularis]
MYGEHPDGGMREMESRNVKFLEEEFPSIGEVQNDLHLYELQEEITQPFVDGGEIRTQPEIDKGSGSMPIEVDSQNESIELRRSSRGNVPRRRFEIDNNAFISISQDDDEPTSFQEVLASSTRDKWLAAMKDEMDSMGMLPLPLSISG